MWPYCLAALLAPFAAIGLLGTGFMFIGSGIGRDLALVYQLLILVVLVLGALSIQRILVIRRVAREARSKGWEISRQELRRLGFLLRRPRKGTSLPEFSEARESSEYDESLPPFLNLVHFLGGGSAGANRRKLIMRRGIHRPERLAGTALLYAMLAMILIDVRHAPLVLAVPYIAFGWQYSDVLGALLHFHAPILVVSLVVFSRLEVNSTVAARVGGFLWGLLVGSLMSRRIGFPEIVYDIIHYFRLGVLG